MYNLKKLRKLISGILALVFALTVVCPNVAIADSELPSYTVSIDGNIEHGILRFADSEDTVKEYLPGDTVTMELAPEEGYEATSFSILDDSGEKLELGDMTDNVLTFPMPEKNVTVTAEYILQKAAYTYSEESGDSYISASRIKTSSDGTEPFDADDEAGNDRSDSNGIVRTFDTINYSIEYTTAIRDSSTTGIDSAYVMVDFILPCDPTSATFNFDTLNWCLDSTLTYNYDDGTSSTVLDASKTVVSQELTGKRLLVNSDAGNTIPGTGTLSVGINVRAAKNGEIIQPVFTLWMEGNDQDEIRSVTADPVIVSAAPKYNLSLVSDSGIDYLGYFDMDSGQISSTSFEGGKYGRLTRYALIVQLYNDNASKGMKGIELPQGEISFDLTLNSELNGTDVTDSENYPVYLWDYDENNTGSTGHLGRSLVTLGATSYAYYGPGNKNTSGADAYCYDGGSFSIMQDETSYNIYHVTVKDYQFDYDNLHFPTRYLWSNAGNVTYAANIGCFSCANIVTLSEFPTDTDTTDTLYEQLTVDNLKVSSLSGADGYDVKASDNRVRKSITLYPVGTITKYMRYTSNSSLDSYLSTTYYGGDNVASIGQDVWIGSFVHGYGEYHWSDFNLLQKFDDKILEIADGTWTYSDAKGYLEKVGTCSILYAAKPDKTGWADDSEMKSAMEEDLIYFTDIEDLETAGYTCVGVLYEMRGYETKSVSASLSYVTMSVKMHVKAETDNIGQVAQTVSELRAWRYDKAQMTFSWEDVVYDASENSYGTGGAAADGYVDPYAYSYTGNRYTKAYYVDGVMYGHTGGYQYGNSLLIIGDKTGVKISVADKTGNDAKYVYDLDAGERTATFTVQPSISLVSANNQILETDITDTLTVKVTLPKGLTFNETGVSLTPDSVTTNSDGTTTVIWTISDVNLTDVVDPITFSTTIGEEGTANDVSNNDILAVSASVTSKNDLRGISSANGNYSETSITVIRLAASAVTKRVVEPLVELGQTITYRLRYSNLSEVIAEDVRLYDILPYNGDGRDTSYTGKYIITDVTMDFSHAENTFAVQKDKTSLYYSTDEADRSQDAVSNALDTDVPATGVLLTEKSILDDKITWSNVGTQDTTALLFKLGNVFGNEYIDVYISISPLDGDGNLLVDESGETQNPGDVYANSFSQNADNQAAVVVSNTVKAQVVHRTLSGVLWLDSDADGEHQDSEKEMSGMNVTLYRTDKSEFDEGEKVNVRGLDYELYEAYDVFGNKIDPVYTSDKSGSYVFDNLPAGDYVVCITNTEGFGLTYYHNTSDTTVDSDAQAVILNLKYSSHSYDDLLDALKMAYIEGISLPEAKNMVTYDYLSEHNDAGFTVLPTPGQAVAKIADKTTGTQLNSDTGRYDGDKTAGVYQNGEKISFFLTVTNTGNCQLNDLELYDDISDIEGYMADFEYDMEVGDTLTTTFGNKVTITDVWYNERLFYVSLDTLAPGDSVELECHGYIQNAEEPIEGLTNIVELNSKFDFAIERSGDTFYFWTPNTIVDGTSYSRDSDTVNISGEGSVTILKYDGDEPLEGVEFRLEGTDGTVYDETTDRSGKVVFDVLPAQDYTLTEVKTLPGYTLLGESVKISIPLLLTEDEVEENGVDVSDAFYSELEQAYCFYDLTYRVDNDVNLDMPMSGSYGKSLWFLLLPVMAATAGILFAYRKKRQ